jgi:hypothetical protein
MRWRQVLAVALATGVVALVASALAANLAIHWYDVNAFEGAPQFFIVILALAGALAGAVVGVVASLLVPTTAGANVSRALATSMSTVLVLVSVLTVTARVLAHIPPEIDGEQLFLLVELRASEGHASPAWMPGVGFLQLGATGLVAYQKQEGGPLFTDDARFEGGRWVVPGAVRIFTSRGGRRIDAGIGAATLAGFDVPLAARPGAEHRQWSEWLPRESLPDQFSYRFKVVRRSEPLRVESLGRFEIETVVDSFYTARGSNRVSATSHFRVRHDGQPLHDFTTFDSIARVNGARTVLLVHASAPRASGPCHLLVDNGAQLDVRPFGGCAFPITGRPLTSDAQRFAAARDRDMPWGWVDRQTFATPGLYQVDANIFDTRDLTFTSVEFPAGFAARGLPPPLSLSPDERSFAWFAHGQSQDTFRLGVTDWKANRSYTVPIDRDRMRYIGFETLDPAWVAHHFEWRRSTDAPDVLMARPDFEPLPYRGQLTLRGPGEAQGYVLLPAGEPLRDQVVRMLVEELGGVRLSDTRLESPDVVEIR